jgi:hypothetical protein
MVSPRWRHPDEMSRVQPMEHPDMSKLGLIIGMAALVAFGGTASYAQDGQKDLTLVDGTVHSNPGEMFQHLRTRDNGFAAGNPKDIVNAYPDEFDNVGDLIHQKRDATLP